MLKIGKRFISLDDNNYCRLISIFGIGFSTVMIISENFGFSKEFILSRLNERHYILYYYA